MLFCIPREEVFVVKPDGETLKARLSTLAQLIELVRSL
jgi:hypothetical protein